MLPLASKIKPTLSGPSSVEKYSVCCATCASPICKCGFSSPTKYLSSGFITVTLTRTRSTSTLMSGAGVFCARNGATNVSSRTGSNAYLLIPQRLDRIDARCFQRGIGSEYNTDSHGNAKCNDDGCCGHDRLPVCGPRNQPGEKESHCDAKYSAANRDQYGFGHELTHDVESTGPDRAPDADLTRAFENCGKDDIHDADAAHQQGNGRNRHHHVCEDLLSSLLLSQQSGGYRHREVLHFVVSGIEHGRHNLCDFDAVGAGLQAQIDAVQVVAHRRPAIPKSILKCVQRNINDVVDVLHRSAGILGGRHELLLQHAHDFEPRIIHFDELADGWVVPQQTDLRGLAKHAHQCAFLVIGFV